jgi:hypothetical protein
MVCFLLGFEILMHEMLIGKAVFLIFCFCFCFFQYEGAAAKGGRGPSIWDIYTHRYPGSPLLICSFSLVGKSTCFFAI